MAIGVSPSTDTLPWSPYEVFRVTIDPWSVIKKRKDRKPDKIDTVMHLSGAKKSILAYAKKINGTTAFYNALARTPNKFTIVIGIRGGIKHYGLDAKLDEDHRVVVKKGNNLDYVTLFEILATGIPHKNYDPLKVVRKKHSEITKEMSIVIDRLFDGAASGNRISKELIRNALKPIAERYADLVRGYISGGSKPPLSKSTVDFWRPAKGVYSSKPLVETGQLLNAIRGYVYVEQTAEFAEFAKGIAKTYSDWGYKNIAEAKKRVSKVKKQSCVVRARRSINGNRGTSQATLKSITPIDVGDIDIGNIGDIDDDSHVRVAREESTKLAGLVRTIRMFEEKYLRARNMRENLECSYGTDRSSWPSRESASYEDLSKQIENMAPSLNLSLYNLKEMGEMDLYNAALDFLRRNGAESNDQ